MFRALCTAAEQGACMHKGPLKRVLKDEPRAFMSDRTAPTELLVLDIDNLSLPQMTFGVTSNNGGLTKLHVEHISNMILSGPRQMDLSLYAQQKSQGNGAW